MNVPGHTDLLPRIRLRCYAISGVTSVRDMRLPRTTRSEVALFDCELRVSSVAAAAGGMKTVRHVCGHRRGYGMLDWTTALTGALVFCARVVDVSLGTVRTISIVHGRTKTAFLLGFAEVSIWLAVLSTVIESITRNPFLGAFYALGFATGNVVGIMIEKNLAIGHVTLRVISAQNGDTITKELRALGHEVTTFRGDGEQGPVTELFVVCRRRDLAKLISLIDKTEPGVFFVTEQPGIMSSKRQPIMQPATGWRAAFKKK